MTDKPHVVILGAGFAGVGAMKQLKKAPVRVTLIDRNDYQTFQPLLYQVATDELSRTEIAFPLREMLHDHGDWAFHQATVTEIDLAGKIVHVEDMAPITYDYLVIALGAVVTYFGTKGAPEHAFPLYTMHDAVRLQEHILARFEAADKDPSIVDDGGLTFCVVGGGPTGVETAGAIAELIHYELKNDYPNLPVDKAEVHLYEHGDELLKPFRPRLREYAKKALEERDVQVFLSQGVVAVEPTRVHLQSGDVVNAHTLVWGAGIQANPLAGTLGEESVRGRIVIGPSLHLDDHPEVFVVGDIAVITDAKTEEALPQLGSVAMQSGAHAGENIARLVEGKQPEPFEYKDKGTMATVGRGAAVVQLHSGRTITGHAAWFAWLGVHLTLLAGGEQKSAAFVDWGWNILTAERGKRIHVE